MAPILRIKEARVKIEKADKVVLSGPSTNLYQQSDNTNISFTGGGSSPDGWAVPDNVFTQVMETKTG